MNHSAAIQRSIDLVVSEGNEVVQTSVGWEKVDEVVHLRQPLTSKVRDVLRADTALRYWTSKGSPHDQPSEGFTDDAARVALSFPVSP